MDKNEGQMGGGGKVLCQWANLADSGAFEDLVANFYRVQRHRHKCWSWVNREA